MRRFLGSILSPAVKKLLKANIPSVFFRNSSYSQCGEDLLISFALQVLDGKKPRSYVDIGANHPFQFSNSALFYHQGGQGVLVEPDPDLAGLLRKKRPRDHVLEHGVHFSGETSAVFFLMDNPTLNTFSLDDMERYLKMGHRLQRAITVSLKDINDILGLVPNADLMNIDIEGLDQHVLEKVNWAVHRPKFVCVETLTYVKAGEPSKLTEIVKLMERQDYMLYADTYINSIFVDHKVWESHWRNSRDSA